MSLKLPTFLALRPDIWFQQTEAQFSPRGITDPTTQYFYLLMAGDMALTLKNKVDGVYGLADDQKADRLLDLEVSQSTRMSSDESSYASCRRMFGYR